MVTEPSVEGRRAAQAKCLKAIANFVWGYSIVDEGDGLQESSKVHNNALAIAIGEIFDPQDNTALVEALDAYADESHRDLRAERDELRECLRELAGMLQHSHNPKTRCGKAGTNCMGCIWRERASKILGEK